MPQRPQGTHSVSAHADPAPSYRQWANRMTCLALEAYPHHHRLCLVYWGCFSLSLHLCHILRVLLSAAGWLRLSSVKLFRFSQRTLGAGAAFLWLFLSSFTQLAISNLRRVAEGASVTPSQQEVHVHSQYQGWALSLNQPLCAMKWLHK